MVRGLMMEQYQQQDLDEGCWMLGATAGWIVMVRRRFMTNPLCMHSRHWHEQRIKDEGPDPETH